MRVSQLLSMRELPPIIGLTGIVIFFTLQTGNFWSPQTMTAVSTIASTVGIVAIGVTMLMISGEFDLSVGSVYVATPFAMALAYFNGVPLPAANKLRAR